MKRRRHLTLILLVFMSFLVFPNVAKADDCPTIDFSKLGYAGSPIARWKNGEPIRVITWASNPTVIGPDQVSTLFTSDEQAWLEQAFNNYGEILDSIAFQKVDNPATANIVIGYTMLSKGKIPTETSGGNFGLWGFDQVSQKAGILLLDPKLWPTNFNGFKSQNGFMLRVENELGNVLGVPDVDPFGPKQALVSVYDTSKFDAYGQTKINNYDAAIIRQLYGESTCSANYSSDSRAKNLAADRIIGEKFIGKLTSPTSSPSPKISQGATRKVMIVCVKGSSIKKIVAAKPVCPKGYTKR